MNYTLELYSQMFCRLKRGNTKGVFSNAKPIFLMTLLNYPSFLLNNKLYWNDSDLKKSYEEIFHKYDITKVTPIWKPFFFLSSEPFYNLIWKQNPPFELVKRPSGHILKEYLDYAKLDDELWELLQDETNRQYLRECIINHYFMPANSSFFK